MALYQLIDTDGTVDRMTFNTAGKYGRLGPTLPECRNYYGGSNSSWWNDSNNYLNMSETGIQQWTVPATGIYEITAKGASGGHGGGTYHPSGPGSGATVKISLELDLGTVINIVCGQTSSTVMSNDSNGSGGGGGTWVYNGNKAGNGLIVVAGGGGGWGHGGNSNKKGLGLGGSDNGKSRGVESGAPLTWSAQSSTVYSSGTVDGGSDGYSVRGIGLGGRGIQESRYGGGGGGAGWLGEGEDPATNKTQDGEGGSQWIGGKGKSGTTSGTSQGGFGGGGGGGGTGIGGGGGGGYSGGGAANTWISVNAGGNTSFSWGAGGGGGSAWKGGPNTTDSHFFNKDATLVEVTGGSDGISMTGWNNLDNSGYVIIDLISTGPPTGQTPQDPPENATVPIPTVDITFLLLKQIYIRSGITTASGHQALITGGAYDFTTHTFTNCGKTGNIGPELTDCISSYGTGDNWWNNTNLFNVIGKSGVNGIQVWTVPDNGYYEVDAYGARGGGVLGVPLGSDGGGLGARMKSRFYLAMGDKYMILCGQQGIEGQANGLGSSGGGGTFFVKGDDYSTVTLAELQLAAGGGGGRGSTSDAHGGHGEPGQGVYSESVAGGAYGGYGAGGGGGLISNGSGNGYTPSSFTGGYSFKNGGEGGTGGIYLGNNGASGGFGGGGGASVHSGSGGGGVYGGDGASPFDSDPNGHGGGSHNKGLFIEQTTGVNDGDGKIIITATDESGGSRTVVSSTIQLSYFRGLDFESGDEVPDDPLPISINSHFKGQTFTTPGLYAFTSHTFTNCGADGMDGPLNLTECKNTYGANIEPWNNTSYFNMVDPGIQMWTVPITGPYTIAAYGAEGGTGFHYATTTNGAAGGKGAIITGTFNLTSGDILWIVVGQKGHTFGDGAGSGSTSYTHRPGAGGGGTYVVRASPSDATKEDILVIAGGGGGGRGRTTGIGQQVGGDALTTETGSTTGEDGAGGSVEASYYYGFSGAGFVGGDNGNGRIGYNMGTGWAVTYFDDFIPQSYKNGSRGGKVETWAQAQGGFGGGGGAGLVPGGGGGYSGGNTTGSWSSSGNAYGGGSKNNGTNKSASATHTGHGKVIITFNS